MIWSDQRNEWIYGTVLKYAQRFFYGPRILEREHLKTELNNWDQTFYVFKSADLRKIGLQMAEWRFRELSS